ncbi:hypothetical protein N7457_003197 [Penicillium paradoxum]|uniref:uncharacterized protein n=1 Tax=Penicillium paradoxum TaxID=176176 RepID=UPI002547BD37|nr:uncharacterized protein N7457_003197 [Penicillium paradoxum]KAJ5788207.1 hypothetical protein N7457_003197 [Penicillium paradoxum]
MTITTSTLENSNKTPQRLLLISVPRTASNLLLKILNLPNQPNALTNERGGYFFHDAFEASGKDGRLQKPLCQWTADQKNQTTAALQQAVDKLESYTTRAHTENKIMFTKEHAFWFLNPGAFTSTVNGPEKPEDLEQFQVSVPECYGPSRTFSPNNQTVLPDEYLRTWRLAFIIRHPALAWPSMYRAMQKLSEAGFTDEDGVKGVSVVNMSFKWTRKLFDWCIEQSDRSVTPLVIDANDVIRNPDVVAKFCENAGLDIASMQYEWTEARNKSDSSKPPCVDVGGTQVLDLKQQGHSIFLSTLQESTGVVKDKAPVLVDIDAEVAKWRVEFGDEAAGLIEKATRDALPDYEYLRAHRVVV